MSEVVEVRVVAKNHAMGCYGLETFYASGTTLLLIVCASPFTFKSHSLVSCALVSHDSTRSSWPGVMSVTECDHLCWSWLREWEWLLLLTGDSCWLMTDCLTSSNSWWLCMTLTDSCGGTWGPYDSGWLVVTPASCVYSCSKNCPNVWLFCKDWCGVNWIN